MPGPGNSAIRTLLCARAAQSTGRAARRRARGAAIRRRTQVDQGDGLQIRYPWVRIPPPPVTVKCHFHPKNPAFNAWGAGRISGIAPGHRGAGGRDRGGSEALAEVEGRQALAGRVRRFIPRSHRRWPLQFRVRGGDSPAQDGARCAGRRRLLPGASRRRGCCSGGRASRRCAAKSAAVSGGKNLSGEDRELG